MCVGVGIGVFGVSVIVSVYHKYVRVANYVRVDQVCTSDPFSYFSIRQLQGTTYISTRRYIELLVNCEQK